MTDYFGNKIENIGATEQVIRGSVGMALIEMVLLIPTLSPTLIAVFSMTAVYAVFTAIMSWDPIYALARSSHRRGAAVKAGVTPYPAQSREKSVSRAYKKAA